MKYRDGDIACTFRVIDLISQDSLDRLNMVFHTSFKKTSQAAVKINRKDLSFEQYKKLMEQVPGFGKREQYQAEVR